MKTLKEINAEISYLSQLVEAEKEEEIREFEMMQSDSLAQMRKNGLCRYPVHITDQLFNKGEKILVKLENVGNQAYQGGNLFKSGKIIKLFEKDGDDENSVSGTINNSTADSLTVTLNTDASDDWMLQKNLCAMLMFDNSTYEEAFKAIKLFAETEDAHMNHLKSVFYGNTTAEFDDDIPFTEFDKLNKNQNLALKHINNTRDVAIVHGPPGTGKTTVLVRAIIQTLRTEKRVLVVAPGNAAVDNIASMLQKLFVNVIRIGNPARVDHEILECTLESKIADHPDYKNIKVLRKKADEYRRLARKYKRNFGATERQQRELLFAEAKKISKEADNLAFYVINNIIDNAEVICATPVGCNSKEVADLEYNTVFIDEAAQAIEPLCFIPILKAKRVILAGDHCQLPPTVKSRAAVKGGLTQTLFEKIINNCNVDVMLNEQYRMNDMIMEFSNRKFYNNKLIAAENCKNRKVFDDDSAFEFIDTSGTGFDENVDENTFSTFNKGEAGLLRSFLEKYIEYLESAGKISNLDNIGIISPYKAQCAILQQEINDSALPDYIKSIIQIDTADSYQGREKDMIIISLTRSNDKGEIGFLSDVRRMNVAMTRAKKKLVMIGDGSTVSHHKFYDDLLIFAQQSDAYKSAFEYIY